MYCHRNIPLVINAITPWIKKIFFIIIWNIARDICYSLDNDKEDFFDPWSYGIYNEGNVAMTVHARYIARGLEEAALEGKIDEYDFVSWPIWDIDNPTQPYTGGNFYSISPYTEHPDEAFKVIEYLISDEWLDYIDPLDYNMEGLKEKNMEEFNRTPLNVHETMK